MKEAQIEKEAEIRDTDTPHRGMARIVRDDQGNIVDIVEHEEEETNITPWGAELNKDEEREPSRVMLPPVLNKKGENTAVKGLLYLTQNLSVLRLRICQSCAIRRPENTLGWLTWSKHMVTTTKLWLVIACLTLCKRPPARSGARTYALTSIRKAGGVEAFQ